MTQDNDFRDLFDFVDDLAAFTDAVFSGVQRAAIEDVDDIVDEIDGLIGGILDRIFDEIRDIGNEINDIGHDILTRIDDELESVADELGDLSRNFRDDLDLVSREVERVAEDIARRISEGVSGLVDLTDALLIGVESRVTATINGVADDVEGVVSEISDKVESRLARDISDVEDVADEIRTRVVDLAGSLNASLGDIGENLAPAVTQGFGAALGGIFGRISGLFDFFSRDGIEEELVFQDPLFLEVENDPDGGETFKRFTKSGIPQLAVGAIGAIIGVLVVLPIQMGATAFSGMVEKIRQNSWAKERPRIFAPAELLELMRREHLTPEQIGTTLAKNGFKDEDSAAYIQLSRQLLSVAEVVALWHRREIDEAEARQRLKLLGFTDDDVSHVETLAFPIPPIQDLITFAVREAFQLDVADQFGQLFGLPDEIRQSFEENLAGFGAGVSGSIGAFAEFAARQGLSPEWIATYWAAHWREPGTVQLFQMLHRLDPEIVEARRGDFLQAGLDPDQLPFTIDTLRTALQKQDLTPFWWERLTAIAYHPLTRVDVRRMHALGLIDRDNVKQRYRELGFSPDDAELMTRFTEAFNDTPDEDEAAESRELTRTQIVNFFEDGILATDEAITGLVEIGFDSDSAEIIIESKLIDLIRRERDLAVRTIEIRFDNELIDFNTALTELDSLELPPVQRDNILARFEAERANRVRLPSRAELDKFVEERLITVDEYRAEMIRLGFPDIWADRFATLNDPDN